MVTEVFCRHEKKYLVNQEQYQELMRRLEEHITKDPFHKEQDFMHICNIYYDTPTDEFIRSSIEKPVYKEKFRVRSYGVPELSDKVFLEVKKKFKGVVYKRRTVMPLSQAYEFIENKKEPVGKGINRQILHEILYFLNSHELHPKVYIAYDRKAFYSKKDKSLRITFDSNIRTRREDLKLELGSYGTPLLDGRVRLMEIKASSALPLWLTAILSEEALYSTSFSKYGTEYKEYMQYVNNINRGEGLCLNQFLKVQQIQGLKSAHR